MREGPPGLLRTLLDDQHRLQTPAAEFSRRHDDGSEPDQARYYKTLLPLTKPGAGEQYAFEVNLDACTGCKACVVACHSLNGLDEDESWRDVGTLAGPGYLQTVTTACHHCADPACANGCPTLAYEKDQATGIVRHLDDQCIGCSYCTMKCPYDVPKYNARLGIVRKCDMCQSRLAEGEAPACVQACPNGAIAIRVVQKASVPAQGNILPGAWSSDYTLPATRYVSAKPLPSSATEPPLRTETAHTPLAVMLVLTQAAAGAFTAAAVFGESQNLLRTATALLLTGITASISHLGQPLKAWKAFLGWRKSWLSREILAFGPAMLLAAAASLTLLPAWPAALASLIAVVCSIMVYVDTRRESWTLARTAPDFLGTTAVVGAALAACWLPALAPAAAILAAMKLGAEALRHTVQPDDWSLRVQRALLPQVLAARLLTGLAGIVTVIFLPPAGAVLLGISEIIGRSLYFRTVRAPRMPGL